MSETEQRTSTEGLGTAVEPRHDGEMGGAPVPADMTLPDPRAGDRSGDFEGETDPQLRDSGTRRTGNNSAKGDA